jgi:hypothetical protein
VIKKFSHFSATMLIHSILQHRKQHWWRITILAIALGYHWLTLNKTQAGAKAKPAGGLGEAFRNAEYPTPASDENGAIAAITKLAASLEVRIEISNSNLLRHMCVLALARSHLNKHREIVSSLLPRPTPTQTTPTTRKVKAEYVLIPWL